MTTKKDGGKQSFYGPLYIFLRALFRVLCTKRKRVYGLDHITTQPAVFVARHQNAFGPSEILAWTPLQVRLWVYSVFTQTDQCRSWYADYTFGRRMGWPRPLAWLAAVIAAPVVVKMNRSMGAIPVYRGSREIIKTFTLSLNTLKKGENLLIIPERDYLDQSDTMGDMYAGYLHLAEFYYKQTGKALHFYPIHISRERRAIYIEPGLAYDPTRPKREERNRLKQALIEALSPEVATDTLDTAATDAPAQ